MAIATGKPEVSRNPLADWIVAVVRFVQRRRQLVLAALVALALIAVGIAGYMWYRDRRETAGQQVLSQAVVALRPEAPDPTKPQAPPAPKTDEAIKQLQGVADTYSGTEAAEEALIRLGNLQWEAEKVDAAGEAFSRYLRQYPRGRFAMMAAIGQAYAQESKGDFEGGVRTLTEAVGRHKDSPLAGEAYTAMGRLYEELKKPEDATRVYNQIIEKFPQTSWAQIANYRLTLVKAK